MKKQLSRILIFTLIFTISLSTPLSFAQDDPNEILFKTFKESALGQRIAKSNIDPDILIIIINTLEGQGFASKLINIFSDELNKNHDDIRQFIIENYGVTKTTVETFINIIRQWKDAGDDNEQIFRNLIEKLVKEDSTPTDEELKYLGELRTTVLREMDIVISKWNSKVLKDSNTKTEFILEIIDKFLENIKVVEQSNKDLEFQIISEDLLKEDIKSIEDIYLQDGVKITKSDLDYMSTTKDIILILNNLFNETINMNQYIYRPVAISLIKALGIQYNEYVPPAQDDDTPSGGGGGGGGSAPSDEEDEVTISEEKEEPIIIEVEKDAIKIEVKDGVAEVSVDEEKVVEIIEKLAEVLKESGKGRKAEVVLEIGDVENANLEVAIPSDIVLKLQESKVDLVIKSEEIEYNIPFNALVNEDLEEGAIVEFKSKELTGEEVNEVKKSMQVKGNVAKVLDLSLEITVNDKTKNVTKFNSKITVKVKGERLGDKDKLGVFYVNDETKELEFVGGKIKDGMIIFKTNHYSKYAVIESTRTFSDVVNHWAKHYIESMVAKNVVDGYDDNTFLPEGDVTRAEFAKMLVTAMELDIVEYRGGFTDIAGGEWYADYIATAKAAGLIDGYDDGTFKPNKNITREEMAKMIGVVLEDVEIVVEDIGRISIDFADGSNVSPWAKESVAKAYKVGLMNGVGGNLLSPTGTTTRAQAVTVIYRLYNR